MKQLRKPLIFRLLLALVCLAPLHAQTSTPAPADVNATSTAPTPSGQAPDEATKKISDLVHAGKYADAQQLTNGLLIAYPNDQRLIKAKGIIDQLLSPAGVAASTAANAPSAQPASTADQLTGMDKVDYNALIVLARQAQQTPDLDQQKKLLKQFMDQSGAFLQKHPEQMLIWELRAQSAVILNDPMAGYEAGQKLLSAGAADSNDTNLLQLLGQLRNMGWMDRQGVEKSLKLSRTIAVRLTGDAADDGIARGQGGGNLSINLKDNIQSGVTSQLQARFPNSIVQINSPVVGEPALKVTINLSNTVWDPTCGMWWECDPVVDSDLAISVSSRAGPVADHSYHLHMTAPVSKTFGGNFYDRLFAPLLPQWMGQAVQDKFSTVLGEDAVRASLGPLTPEPAVPDSGTSAPIGSSVPLPAPAAPTPANVSSSPALPATPVVQEVVAANAPAPMPPVTAASPASVSTPAPTALAASPAAGTAILHVYRTKHALDGGAKFEVSVDGSKVAQISSGQTSRMGLASGSHAILVTLKLGKKIPATNLDMEAGKEYWLRIEVVNSFPTGYLVLTQVSAEQAQAESKKLEELKLGDLSGQH